MPDASRRTVLVERHLLQMAEGMCAEMIMTPSERLATAEPEEPFAAAAARLAGFDQAPVLDGARPIGILRLAAGELAGRTVRESMNAVTEADSLRTDTPIADSIERLARHDCLLVFNTHAAPQLAGLLHFADLNKHAVRTYCYLWLAALELALAQLVREHCRSVEDWIAHLDERSQVQVLGRYEFQRRQSVHVDHLEGVELTDLLRIVERCEPLRSVLGFGSPTAFQKVAAPLASLRHDAMHPVRSMIRGHNDVPRLARRLADLRALVATAHGGRLRDRLTGAAN